MKTNLQYLRLTGERSLRIPKLLPQLFQLVLRVLRAAQHAASADSTAEAMSRKASSQYNPRAHKSANTCSREKAHTSVRRERVYVRRAHVRMCGASWTARQRAPGNFESRTSLIPPTQ